MNLIEFLKNNQNSRKIFGKKELKIIEKQLLGISLTQSEKNRLSRDIREKMRFIEEINKFSNDFDLKKGEITKKMVIETIDTIKEDFLFYQIKRIFIFGSLTENTLTFRSDIDIAVEFEKITIKEATKFRIRISGKLPDKVDIQVFNVLPGNIKKEIIENGKIVYEKN